MPWIFSGRKCFKALFLVVGRLFDERNGKLFTREPSSVPTSLVGIEMICARTGPKGCRGDFVSQMAVIQGQGESRPMPKKKKNKSSAPNKLVRFEEASQMRGEQNLSWRFKNSGKTILHCFF